MKKKSKFNVFTFMMLIILGLTFQPAISTYAACPDGITSYWKLDEANGPTYQDFIADNDGTGAADPDAATGEGINGAQTFDGTTQGIDVTADRSFNWLSSDSFSIEVWVKMDAPPPAGERQVIVGRRDADTPTAIMAWFIAVDDNGNAILSLRDPDSSSTEIGAAGANLVTDPGWHHVVAVRDSLAGAGTPPMDLNRLYVDGQLQGSNNIDYTAGFLSNSAKINIGWYDFPGNEFRFKGLIDEVALYNKALSPGEIQQHYNNGTPIADYCMGSDPPDVSDAPFPDDTISLWPLDEANGPEYFDSFADNDGTGAADPDAATGEGINGAQTFDGTTQGIDVTADSSFNWLSSDSFSIEVWVKMDAPPPAGERQVIVGRRDADTPAAIMAWFIAVDDNGNAILSLKDPDSSSTEIGAAGANLVTDPGWHHVVALRDPLAGAGTPPMDLNRLYVDGQLQGSNNIDYTAGFLSNSAKINIGWYDFPGNEFRFKGLIDEVALYDRALDPVEDIEPHYTAGLAGKDVQSLRPAPVANAGVVPDVTEGAPVMLNGGASTEGYAAAPLSTYVWEQLPGGTPVTINNDTATPTATFTAPPDVAAAGETLKFQLTLTASDDQSDIDSVDVGIVDSPVADAGDPQNVTEGDTPVRLNGNGSTGRNISYAWIQTPGTPAINFTGASTATPSFTAPDVAAPGEPLTFQLTVTDDVGATSTATVVVNVADASGPLLAVAGDDQTVAPGAPVTLDGSGSTGTGLTYAWLQTAGTRVQLEVSDPAKPTFTAPSASDIAAAVLDTLTFELTVTDNTGTSSAPATTNVNVDDGTTASSGGGGGGGGGCFINSMF